MSTGVIEKLKWRYATKKFDATRKLSEAQIGILTEAFNLTATSYGLQPLRMLVISNKNLQEKLLPLSMHQKQVQEASHVLVICIEDALDSAFIKNYFSKVEKDRGTPRHILTPFEEFLVNDFKKKSAEDIEQWMAKQAYLALGNLLTVCALEGIDACPMEGFDPEGYDAVLGLKEKNLKSVLVLPVGYRSEEDPFAEMKKVRRGVEEVIITY